MKQTGNSQSGTSWQGVCGCVCGVALTAAYALVGNILVNIQSSSALELALEYIGVGVLALAAIWFFSVPSLKKGAYPNYLGMAGFIINLTVIALALQEFFNYIIPS
jgi:hypothetical protein